MNTPKTLANYLKEYFLTKLGNNTITGHIFVSQGSQFDLGSSSKPLRAIYADTLVGSSGSVDEKVSTQAGGTAGYLSAVLSFSSDFSVNTTATLMSVSLANTVLKADGSVALTGNLLVNNGITIDGVDISAFKTLYDAHIANPNAHHNTATLAVNSGLTLSIQEFAMGTPSTLTAATVNAVTTSTHSHAITSTNDGAGSPGQILKTDGTGLLILSTLRTPLINTASGNMTIAPASNLIFNPALSGGVMEVADSRGIKIGTSAFFTGFTGSGARLDHGITNTGVTTLTVDDLVVRGRMNVYELVIHQIRATNGNIFVSDGSKISVVTDLGGGTYKLEVDGKTNDYQTFAVNDKIRAQRIGVGSGILAYRSDMTVTVINTDGNPKRFTATLVGGTDVPTVGMEFVRIGNSSDTSRQGAVYLTSSDSGAPFIDIVDGITSHADWNTSGKVKVRLGKLSGITDTTLNPTGYGLYSTNAYLKGILSAANDEVRIDSTGIRIKSAAATGTSDLNSLRFTDSTNVVVGGIYSNMNSTLGLHRTTINAIGNGTRTSSIQLYSGGGGASGLGNIEIIAQSSNVDKLAKITLNAQNTSSPGIIIDSYNVAQTLGVIWLTAPEGILFFDTARPNADLSANLGTASQRWGVLYVDQIIASTISGTSMSGQTWQYTGSMIIDAVLGTDTTVSITNTGAGRVDLNVDRNIIVGGLVDGVDISSFKGLYDAHIVQTDAHHAQVHALVGGDHTASGLTIGHTIRATGATTFAWAQLQHSDLGGLTTGDPHCFSSDTELLTERGFVCYQNIREDDKALTFNITTKKLEYQQITGMYVYDNFDSLVSIKNKKLDILVTPLHELIYTHRGVSYNKETAENILSRKVVQIPINGFLESKPIDLSDDFITLLGLIISEGHFLDPKKCGYGIKIYQLQSKAQFIEDILISCNVTFTKHTRNNVKTSQPMIEFYISSAYARENIRTWIDKKQLSDKLMNLSGKQFWALLKGLVYGDGMARSKHLDKSREELIYNIEDNMKEHIASYTYCSVDKELIDQIVHLCTLNGVRAYTYYNKGGFKNGAWRINFSYLQNIVIRPFEQGTYQSYSGDVWCVTVPNHTLVVRRNGIVYIAGNTQYVAIASPRTITSVHTFNPAIATPWIILGANATGQLIAGLNADQLDGFDSTVFPRKAENATISGAWTFNADIALGTGVQLQFATELTDKIYFNSNTYGIGLETGTLTSWTVTNHRWRIGGTSASTGTEEMLLNASGLTITDVLTAGNNVDTVHILGKSKIGFVTAVAGEFGISHYDFASASNYALKQTSTGNVMLNAPTGDTVDIRNNNISKLNIAGTTISSTVNVGINKVPTVALDVLGDILGSGIITIASDTDSTHILGRGKIGFLTAVADELAISHFDHATASNYMIKQTSTGNVMVNAPTGGTLALRTNNANRMTIGDSTISTTVNLGIGMSPANPLDVTGAIRGSTTIAIGENTDVIHVLGRGRIGFVTGVANEFGISHYAFATASNYMIKQTSSGNVMINSPTGSYVELRNNNSSVLKVEGINVTLAASKAITSATFDSLTPISGFKINEVAGNIYSLTIGVIQADELRVRTFVADEVRVDRGDEYWTKSYGIIETQFTTPSILGGDGVEVWFENSPAFSGGIFSDADWIMIRIFDNSAGLFVVSIWGQVYSASSGGVGGYLPQTDRQRWRFVLRSGTTSYTVKKGSLAVCFGATNQAFVHLSANDTSGAPYIRMGRWSGANPYTPANRVTEVIMGKLSSVSGPVGTVGFYASYGNATFEASDGGLRLVNVPFAMYNGANQTVNISTSGNDVWIGPSSGDKRLHWNGTTLTIVGNGNGITNINGGNILATSSIAIGPATTWQSDGIQIDYNVGNPRFYVGDGGVAATDRYFMFDGTTISFRAANTTLDTSGNLTASNVNLSGTITATAGSIGGWTINSTNITATSLTLTPGAANVANITVGSGSSSAGINSAAGAGDVAFWAGETHANRATALFRVNVGGNLFASAGNIAGWVLNSNSFTSTNISIISGAANTANISVGTGTTAGGINSANAGSDLVFWAGNNHANRGIAPFRINANGSLFASSADITGTITASSGSITGILSIGASGEIRQGTGTWGSNFTGLRIYNTGGIGAIAGYNNNTAQWYAGSDGKFYAGGGTVTIDSTGITFPVVTDSVPKLKFGSGTSETGRIIGSTDLVGHGDGFIDILVRSTDATNSFGQLAYLNLLTTNTSWGQRAGIKIWSNSSGDGFTQIVGGVGESWTSLSFVSGWGNFNSVTFQSGQYKKFGDLVFLRGLVGRTSGVSTTIANLPAGYRPSKEEVHVASSGNAYGEIRITTAGAINIAIGSVSWISLDGIYFSIL